jgi:hypothetical protein
MLQPLLSAVPFFLSESVRHFNGVTANSYALSGVKRRLFLLLKCSCIQQEDMLLLQHEVA